MLLRLVEPVRWVGSEWHWFVATKTPTGGFALHGVNEAEAETVGDGWLSVPDTWRGQSPVARAEVGE